MPEHQKKGTETRPLVERKRTPAQNFSRPSDGDGRKADSTEKGPLRASGVGRLSAASRGTPRPQCLRMPTSKTPKFIHTDAVAKLAEQTSENGGSLMQ